MKEVLFLLLFGCIICCAFVGLIEINYLISGAKQHEIDKLKYDKELVRCIKNAISEKEEKICALNYAINIKDNRLLNKLK